MESENTVAEADSTLILPPLDPLNLSTMEPQAALDSSPQSPPLPSSTSTTPSLPIELLISESGLFPSASHSSAAGYLSPSSPGTGHSNAITPTDIMNSEANAASAVTSPALTSPAMTPTGLTPAYLSPSALTPTVLTPPISLIPPASTYPPTTSSSHHPTSITITPLTSIPLTSIVPLAQLSQNSVGNPVNLAPLHSPVSAQNPASATIGNAQTADSQDSNPQDLENFTWRHDPLASPDWDRAGPPGNLCAGRVRKDLSSIFTEPLPGIFAVPEEDNMFKVHCLIIGPFDTPYEGGFFHFLVRFGPQYPLHPPRVKLLTTGGGSVRFNPNLYRNGKVCLSILGTWPGPAWSPASNLSSVLLSLQSLMNERPYHNEPGYEEERNIGDSERYNSIISHESLRVSVIQQLDVPSTMPSDLHKVMQESFMEYYDHYVDICHKNIHKDGHMMNDPFGELRGRFHYTTLLKQLRRLKAKLKAIGIAENPETSVGGAESEDASSISGSEDGSPESLEEQT